MESDVITPESTAADRKYQAPAAGCAAEILLALARSRSSLGLVELTQQTGCSRSLVYRTLKELESRSLISEDLSRPGSSVSYQLGVATIEIGGAYAASVPFMQSVRGILKSLATSTKETASLAVLEGASALYLMREEGANSVFSVSQVGKRLPANATGVGKALLAQMTDGEIRQLYAKNPDGLRAITDRTLTTVPELLKNLRETRLNGYSFEDGEVVAGRCCVGVAIKLPDHALDTIGISVSTDRQRLDAGFREELIQSVLTARELLLREVDGRSTFGDENFNTSTHAVRAAGGFF